MTDREIDPEMTSRIRKLQQNPIEMEEILQKIFQFLDSQTLQEARQVSLLWEIEATKQLFYSSTYIRCPPNLHTQSQEEKSKCLVALESLTCILNTTYCDPPLDLRLQISDLRDLHIYLDAQLFNSSVRRLAFGDKEGGSGETPGGLLDTELLATVLTQLPKLETLETNCLDLSPQQSWFLETPQKLHNLLEKLSTLKKLKLNFWLHEATLRSYLSFRTILNSINSLRINRKQVFSLYREEGLTWKIKRLRLMINNEMEMDLVRQFLRQLAPSLVHLRLSFFFRRVDVDNFIESPTSCLDVAQSHIPWNLTNLKSLDIYEDDARLEFIVCKTIGVALQLPNLKKLIIRASITLTFDEMLRQWTRYSNIELRSESLREVVIWPNTFSSSLILFSNLWPNLKALIIKVDINERATAPAILAIFSQMSKLERLEFYLKDEHRQGQQVRWNFDELLTGVRRPLNYEAGHIVQEGTLELTQFRSIRNLICLKSLIVESVCCQSHNFTDFFIYNGLIHLKQLQSLQMTKKFIAQKSLDDLREALGSHVNVYFYE